MKLPRDCKLRSTRVLANEAFACAAVRETLNPKPRFRTRAPSCQGATDGTAASGRGGLIGLEFRGCVEVEQLVPDSTICNIGSQRKKQKASRPLDSVQLLLPASLDEPELTRSGPEIALPEAQGEVSNPAHFQDPDKRVCEQNGTTVNQRH